MVKRLHLTPRERQEMVDSLMGALRPQLSKYIEQECARLVARETVERFVQDAIKSIVIPKIEELALQEPLEPRWFARFLFSPRKPR